jgi:hypothetical protein
VAPPIPDDVPVVFTAGVTVKFRRAFNDYPPSDGWTYKIYFNGATDVFNVEGIVDPQNSSAWLVTINPSDSEVPPPGLYRYVERASSPGGEVYDVGEGVVQIEPDLATAAAGVDLSFAEQTLAMIEAEIQARITADVEEYSVQASSLGGGRSVKKIPMAELQKLRGYYGAMVRRKKNPGTIGTPVAATFVDESQDQKFPPTWVDVTGLPGAGQ